MIQLHIPLQHLSFSHEKQLSPLVRPFYANGQWQVDEIHLKQWQMQGRWVLTSLEQAELLIFPMHAHYYKRAGHWQWVKDLCSQIKARSGRALLFIAGDFGEVFPDLPGLTYLRLGGFDSQMSEHNLSMPFMLSDHMKRLFQTDDIEAIPYSDKAVVGFCGHASGSKIKAAKEYAKFIKENGRRFIKNGFSADFEPLFASALERWKMLKRLEMSQVIDTNFIYRKHYRAGAQTAQEREQTTLEYYRNIRESAYILCMRGGGNFSVRFYETLMMGRIPIFINTDCRLPFAKDINWKKHVVWVEWKDRKQLAEIVNNFHRSMDEKQFLELQLDNRRLWLKWMTIGALTNHAVTAFKTVK